jgi:RNA polymerase sigma factor (sigma-70 family)
MATELPCQRAEQTVFNIRSLREDSLIDQMDLKVESGQRAPHCFAASESGETLDELFGKCIPRLFRAADCILHNPHDSEDALQDGFLSALRHLDQFKGNSRFSTWMFSIIRNSALAKLRKRRAHPVISLDDHSPEDETEQSSSGIPADHGLDPERACARGEISFLLARTLKGLPANYRAIIRLCDIEGYSGREAAKLLGITVSALKAQHHRARVAIRESMGAHFAKKRG